MVNSEQNTTVQSYLFTFCYKYFFLYQATSTGWHHVVYVYSGQQLTIYVDNAVVNSVPISGRTISLLGLVNDVGVALAASSLKVERWLSYLLADTVSRCNNHTVVSGRIEKRSQSLRMFARLLHRVQSTTGSRCIRRDLSSKLKS